MRSFGRVSNSPCFVPTNLPVTMHVRRPASVFFPQLGSIFALLRSKCSMNSLGTPLLQHHRLAMHTALSRRIVKGVIAPLYWYLYAAFDQKGRFHYSPTEHVYLAGIFCCPAHVHPFACQLVCLPPDAVKSDYSTMIILNEAFLSRQIHDLSFCLDTSHVEGSRSILRCAGICHFATCNSYLCIPF